MLPEKLSDLLSVLTLLLRICLIELSEHVGTHDIKYGSALFSLLVNICNLKNVCFFMHVINCMEHMAVLNDAVHMQTGNSSFELQK